jgi:hypothetical protein
MSQSGQSVGQTGGSTPSGLATLPAVWVGVVILLSLYHIYSSWPATYAYDLPDSAVYLVYAGLIVSVVNILWGLWLVGLAIGRSVRFPRHFTIWQVANIVWIVLAEVYVLVMPDFVVTLTPLLYAAVEIAIGVICIRLLRHNADTARAYGNAGTERPPVIVSIIAAVIGIIVGGALGFGAGLGIGAFIAEATDMSCFEGACGFFAFFVGLFAMLAGAVAGAVFAVWRTNRGRPAAAA